MLIKIDIYTLKLIKENLLYLVFLIILVPLFLFVVPFQIKSYYQYTEKTKLLNEEIKELERKNTIISTINDDEVDDLIGILDRLLPDIEDYFSILYTLENISYKTGFRIVSYSIKFNKKQSNKIQLAVEGGGSLDTFLDFLDSYQFKGGRLITIDNIKFSPDNFRNSLTLNFYTKQVKDLKEQTELTIDKKTINKINKIAEDFKLNNIEPLEKPSEEHYSVKTNPFAL